MMRNWRYVLHGTGPEPEYVEGGYKLDLGRVLRRKGNALQVNDLTVYKCGDFLLWTGKGYRYTGVGYTGFTTIITTFPNKNCEYLGLADDLNIHHHQLVNLEGNRYVLMDDCIAIERRLLVMDFRGTRRLEWNDNACFRPSNSSKYVVLCRSKDKNDPNYFDITSGSIRQWYALFDNDLKRATEWMEDIYPFEKDGVSMFAMQKIVGNKFLWSVVDQDMNEEVSGLNDEMFRFYLNMIEKQRTDGRG